MTKVVRHRWRSHPRSSSYASHSSAAGVPAEPAHVARWNGVVRASRHQRKTSKRRQALCRRLSADGTPEKKHRSVPTTLIRQTPLATDSQEGDRLGRPEEELDLQPAVHDDDGGGGADAALRARPSVRSASPPPHYNHLVAQFPGTRGDHLAREHCAAAASTRGIWHRQGLAKNMIGDLGPPVVVPRVLVVTLCDAWP